MKNQKMAGIVLMTVMMLGSLLVMVIPSTPMDDGAGNVPAHIFDATATHVWKPTSGQLASTGANWDTGTVPATGDAIVFNETSTANCTFDISGDFGDFTTNENYSGIINVTEDISTMETLFQNGTINQLTSNCTWEFNGNLTLNGTNAIFRQGGDIITHRNITFYHGLLNPNQNSTWTLYGNVTDYGIDSAETWHVSNCEPNMIFMENITLYEESNIDGGVWVANSWIIHAGKTLSVNSPEFATSTNPLYYGPGAISVTIESGAVLDIIGHAQYPSVYYPTFWGTMDKLCVWKWENLGLVKSSVGGMVAFWADPFFTLSSCNITFGNITCDVFLNDAHDESRYWNITEDTTFGGNLSLSRSGGYLYFGTNGYNLTMNGTISISQGDAIVATDTSTVTCKGVDTTTVAMPSYTPWQGLSIGENASLYITEGDLRSRDSYTYAQGHVYLTPTAGKVITVSSSVSAGFSLSNLVFNTSAGGYIDIDASTRIGILKDFDCEYANFTKETSRFTFYGAGNITTNGNASDQFYDLYIQTTAHTTMQSDIYISRYLYVYGELIGSSHTLDANGSTTIYTNGELNQGTGQWNFNGGLTQSGATSEINQGGVISVKNPNLSGGVWNAGDNLIECNGSWTDSGDAFNRGSSTVNFTGTGTITSSLAKLYDVNILQNVTLSQGSDITSHSLYVNGTLISNDYDWTIEGSWDTSTGIYEPGTSTVTLNGVGNLATDGTAFYDFIITSSATITLESNVTVNHTATISGTINYNGHYIQAPGHRFPPTGDVVPPMTASFTFSVSYGMVTFTDTSYGEPISWRWSFGDGTGSTAENPTHQYSAVGKYTVRLVITDASGTVSECSKEVNVTSVTPLYNVNNGTLVIPIFQNFAFKVDGTSAIALGVFWLILSMKSLQRIPIIGWMDRKFRMLLGVAFMLLGVYLYGWFG